MITASTLKKLSLFCLIMGGLSLSPLYSSELQQLADSMQPGTWAALETNGMNQEFLNTSGYNGASFSILQYANKAQWDPISEKYLFLGSPHDNPFKFIIYDSKSNTWESGPLPNSCMEIGHNHGGCWVHSYYYSAIDPNAGKFYFYFLQGIAEYDIASQTWRQLPGKIEQANALYGGLSYFPDERKFVYVAGEYGLHEYNMSTLSWTFLDNYSMGNYHNISLYNPIHNITFFGGGNNSRSIYRMDSNGVVTSLGQAPRDLVLCSSIVTLDPISGNYLICYDDGSFYDFDAMNNTWSLLPSPPPDFYNSIACGTGTIGAPISNYGVAMFLSYSTAKVYLYKHSPGTGNSNRVSAPVIEPNGGEFQDSVPVQLSTRTAGANIYYTLDGSNPTINDVLYNAPINITTSTVVKSFAVKQDYESSSVSSAQFTLVNDTVAPFLLSVSPSLSPPSVFVQFSEPVERTSSENRVNYYIDQGIEISNATLLQDGRTVRLQTSLIQSGVTYELIINNIKDRASKPNTIAPNTRFFFSAEQRVENGLVMLNSFEEGEGQTVNDRTENTPSMNLQINDLDKTMWGVGFLELKGATVLKAVSSEKILKMCRATNEISIECWIRPAVGAQSGPARIITFSKDAYERNFTLGQTDGGFEVRLRTTATDLNGLDESVSASLPLTNEMMHVVYTRSASGTARLLINNEEAARNDNIGGDFSNWENFDFALGNELNGARSWQGEYHLVSIYSRALNNIEIEQNYLAGPFAVTTSLHEGTDPVHPTGLILGQNYPNPFNPKTSFDFFLAASDYVTVDIFSLDGRHVETLYAGKLQDGVHNLHWDGSPHSSGVYLYKVATSTMSMTRKMLYIK
jgi:hypothetical protein